MLFEGFESPIRVVMIGKLHSVTDLRYRKRALEKHLWDIEHTDLGQGLELHTKSAPRFLNRTFQGQQEGTWDRTQQANRAFLTY